MKLKSLFTLGLSLAIGLPLFAKDDIKLIVSSYSADNAKGIYAFNFNQATAKASPLDTLQVNASSYVTISSDGSIIYAVSNLSNQQAAVHAIAFNKDTGHMQLKQSVNTKGDNPCFVETNGNLLLTANRNGGSISVFPLTVEGDIEPLSQQFLGNTTDNNSNTKEVSRITCARFLPDGDGVIATNSSANQLLRFNFKDMKTLGNKHIAAQLPKGSLPLNIAFSTDSRFIYLINKQTNSVTVLQYNFGKIKKIQDIACNQVGTTSGAFIQVSPDGRFLYTSNKGEKPGITIFKINQRNGLLTKVGYQQTGKSPQHFNITPNGKYLLCACSADNIIQVYRINSTTGMLTNTHQNIPLPAASCIQFYPFVMQPDIPGDGVFRVIEVTK